MRKYIPLHVETPAGDEIRSRLLGWRIVLATYCALFGALLYVTKGLPYAIDNNESFSSLWHARHLYDTPFGLTKGLADEVFAWHRAASPFVHTHQGNFPRLFAFLIYLFGARTIESQIVVTTFSVGIFSVWLAFRFLCSIGPPLYATIGCLILLTDYGLFGQWQVDTYRVWYGLFFFGSLFWVSELDRRRNWQMLATGVAGFAAMFYGEYVFAAFVGLTAAMYALFLYARKARLVFKAWLAIFLGGAIAGSVLATQLVAYMGWQNVKLDFGYTLAARNMASNHAFAEKVDRFYLNQRIIFWHNYFDTSNVRSVAAYASSFFSKHLQFYGSWMCLSAMVLLLGAMLGLVQGKREGPEMTRRRIPPWMFVAFGQSVPAFAVAAGAVLILRYAKPQFNETIESAWSSALGVSPPTWLGWVAYVIATSFAIVIAFSGTLKLFGPRGRMMRPLFLSICVIISYSVVYRIFTGYIYSGYLNRQAPFLVFWTDTLLGAAVYLVVEISRRTATRTLKENGPAILPLGGAVLLASFLGAWVTLQLVYLLIIPPNGEPFIKLLGKPPFRGHSFVVNDYPAPEAEKTHAWAYADSSIFSGRTRLTPDGFLVERAKQYLWFADGVENRSYLKPDFGLLIRHPASVGQALDFYSTPPESTNSIAFSTVGLIRRTQEPLQAFFAHKLAATDGSTYSIIKFDWDAPPYLKPVDSAVRAAAETMTLDQKISLRKIGDEQARRWRVELSPTTQEDGLNPAGAEVVLLDAVVDGHTLFADRQFEASGWSRNKSGGWSGNFAHSEKLATVVVGDNVSLRFLKGPGKGSALVTVNDMAQVINFSQTKFAEFSVALGAAWQHQKFMAIPNLSPGVYVNTWIGRSVSEPRAILEYSYAHQEGVSEQDTTVRVYHHGDSVEWELVDAITFLGEEAIPVRLDEFRRKNPDTVAEFRRVAEKGDTRAYEQWLADYLRLYPAEKRRSGILSTPPIPSNLAQRSNSLTSHFRTIPLPTDLDGRLQISVTPGTRSKTGPEFFGFPFDAPHVSSDGERTFAPVQVDVAKGTKKEIFPYGRLDVRLRFPANRPSQAEPLVTAGVEEAADVLYAIYSDSGHIRIGFDHWFKGGPVTDPIPFDYAKDHELEVSMGSLFPPEDDIVFVGMDPERVSDLKGRLRVTLDGKAVIDAPSEFWDSTPAQVLVGRNEVNASTCNPLFHGTILECKRIWPTSP